MEVAAASGGLDKSGMVIDFRILKENLNGVIDKLDHKYLNKIPYFKKINPTSENVARFIYDSLKKRIRSIESVTVWESENSKATYSE